MPKPPPPTTHPSAPPLPPPTGHDAIGYVRVSTEEQALHGVSLDAQREKITSYCRLHGLHLAAVYADEGLSGKRADNRPGLHRAVEHACHTQGVLVVYALSRLARSTRDAIDLAERLDQGGANLASITERIDTTTGMGRFFFTTVAALAQLERDQISERTAAALRHKRARGQRVSGQIPLGFDLDPDGVRLVPNAQEQAVLQTIHDLHRTGASSRQIAAELEERGLKPKGGGRWHPKVVLEIVARGPTLAHGGAWRQG